MLGAVTIDLDGARHYHAIHGMRAPEGGDPLLTRAFPRFLELCQQHQVRATIFVVGKDLEDPDFSHLIKTAHEQGHEIASHSFAHDYKLSAWTGPAIRSDLLAARESIERVTGQPPVGFRAPGYNQSSALMEAVAETGHRYDSSVFPSPAYYMARSVAISRYALKGKPSSSLRGESRQFSGPRRPYRPGRVDFMKPGSPELGIWELPMAVVGPLGLPMIGTFLSLYPRPLRRVFTAYRMLRGGPFNLELHAMDLAEVNDGLDGQLQKHQPDLGVPLHQRMRALNEVLATMKKRLDVLPLRGWLKRL